MAVRRTARTAAATGSACDSGARQHRAFAHQRARSRPVLHARTGAGHRRDGELRRCARATRSMSSAPREPQHDARGADGRRARAAARHGRRRCCPGRRHRRGSEGLRRAQPPCAAHPNSVRTAAELIRELDSAASRATRWIARRPRPACALRVGARRQRRPRWRRCRCPRRPNASAGPVGAVLHDAVARLSGALAAAPPEPHRNLPP